MTSRRREGFVLIAVLWIIAALTAIATVALATSRQATRATVNARGITAATWRGEGCAESVLASIHHVLADSTQSQHDLWSHLPELRPVLAFEPAFGCDVELEAVGARIAINSAAPATIRNVLLLRGIAPLTADSMVAALQDWIDADGDRRPLGAEHDAYGPDQRRFPRNGPLHATRELLQVRGFAGDTTILQYFDVHSAPVVLDRATPAVLRVLPGMSAEALNWIVQQRTTGGSVTLPLLAGALHGSAADTLNAHLVELSSAVTEAPMHWRIVSRAGGAGGVRVSVELIVARDHGVPVILRRGIALE